VAPENGFVGSISSTDERNIFPCVDDDGANLTAAAAVVVIASVDDNRCGSEQENNENWTAVIGLTVVAATIVMSSGWFNAIICRGERRAAPGILLPWYDEILSTIGLHFNFFLGMNFNKTNSRTYAWYLLSKCQTIIIHAYLCKSNIAMTNASITKLSL
jgi:hypothetical protein